ncbi:MAG: nucleoside-diphosphate kinase [Minisyncoccia bacterium]
MAAHPKQERTLVIMKPDAVQRSLIGEILSRYERTGLKLIAMKMLVPTPDMVEKHYLLDPAWKKNVGEKSIAAYVKKGETPPSDDPIKVGNIVVAALMKYLSAGPVVAMVWQGSHAVELVRKVTGGTEPRTSDVGTIRGDYVIDSYHMADVDGRAIRNLIHASGSVGEAEAEIAHWFKSEEIQSYRHLNEAILYDVNLDGILE